MQEISNTVFISSIILTIINLSIIVCFQLFVLKNNIFNKSYFPILWKTLKNFTFKGRASQKEFSVFTVFFNAFGTLLAFLIFTLYKPMTENKAILAAFILFILIFGLWFISVSFVLTARRWHDFNCPFWAYLIIYFIVHVFWKIGMTAINLSDSLVDKVIFQFIEGVPSLFFILFSMAKTGNKDDNKFGSPISEIEEMQERINTNSL